MDSLLNLLKKTESFFATKGIEQPRLDAELIFAHVLGCKRLDLYLNFERPLGDDVLVRLRPLVSRRGRREPLQYIFGTSEFFGLQLQADPRALIPRPETEELVGLLSEMDTPPPQSILDLGTGSGAIALALAKTFPAAAVHAVDQSPEALDLARENARTNGLDGRVQWVHGHWMHGLAASLRFDWIVSNPPYLSDSEWSEAAEEVRVHEPRAALVSAEEGIADLIQILDAAYPALNDGGLVALETGIRHHDALDAFAQRKGYNRIQRTNDLSGRQRFFLAWKHARRNGGESIASSPGGG